MDKLIATLKSELERWSSGWSVGSFGAIGEFHQDDGEVLEVSDTDNLTRATARGAIRIVPRPDMQAVAYELLSPRPRRWSQGMALCLPEQSALGAQRNVLTELGPDTEAIRPADRDGILFDIGLEQPQIDFCIRTSDPELLEILRRNIGKTTFASEAGHAILHAHPHRVVLSKLGRAEVFQKIGGPDTGGKSPEGPHTHVLPKLLAARRTHSANTPIPEGLTPCAFLHPTNPVITTLGDDKPFNPADFARFQAYLDLYGPPVYVAMKKAIWAAVEAGQDPSGTQEPDTRLERVALRNALRQLARQSETTGDELLQTRVVTWRAAFDKLDDAEESETA